jgi:hypothetical protein
MQSARLACAQCCALRRAFDRSVAQPVESARFKLTGMRFKWESHFLTPDIIVQEHCFGPLPETIHLLGRQTVYSVTSRRCICWRGMASPRRRLPSTVHGSHFPIYQLFVQVDLMRKDRRCQRTFFSTGVLLAHVFTRTLADGRTLCRQSVQPFYRIADRLPCLP